MEEKRTAALGYELGDYAPRVLAKGKGSIADTICRIAQENRIPIVKSPHLAYSLFETSTSDYIPEKYWIAVAEILGFVYETRGGDEQYKS